MNRPDKARIHQAFDRAASSYDGAAAVQRRICRTMLEHLPDLPARPLILDAGCGTGFALPLLRQRYPDACPIGLDFSTAMLNSIGTPCLRLRGDIEQLPLADASIDLFWSSLTVQWCDLAQVLGEARRVLRPTGRLAVATLGSRTFHELRHAFARADAHPHTIGFHAPAEITAIATQAGFGTVDVTIQPEILHYPDFKSLLRAVKAVGANQLGRGRRPGLMSRSAFARAEAAIETLRTPAGLPLTYDVIYLTAQP
jgi:malonyl-CoA O-methyltransferase